MADVTGIRVFVDARDATKGAAEANRAFRSMSDEAEKASGEQGIGRLGTAFEGLKRRVMATAAGVVAALGISSLSRDFISAASEAEGYEVRLRSLMGSTEEAAVLFEEMGKYASQVPFEYREIMSAATQLAGVLKGGTEEVKKWMPVIGDLAAVSGLGIEQTTEQFIRMYSAGAASADMFRQRGILAMLGFKQGVSTSSKETMDILWKAWEGADSKIRGATSNLARNWTGILSMFSDKWFQFRVAVMRAGPFDALKDRLVSFLDTLNRLEKEGVINEWVQKTATVAMALGRALYYAGEAAVYLAGAWAFGKLLSMLPSLLLGIKTLGTLLWAAEIHAARYGIWRTLNDALWGTSAAASAASIGVKGLWTSLVAPAIIGWEIGKWASKQFLVVEIAGITMAEMLANAWARIKYYAQVAAVGVKYAFIGVFEPIRSAAADLLSSIGEGFSMLPGGKEAGAMFQGWADRINDSIVSTGNFEDELKRLRGELDAEVKKNKELADSQVTGAILRRRLLAEAKKYTDGVKGEKSAVGALSDEVKKLAKSYEDMLYKAKMSVRETGLSESNKEELANAQWFVEESRKLAEKRKEVVKKAPAPNDAKGYADYLASLAKLDAQFIVIGEIDALKMLMVELKRRETEKKFHQDELSEREEMLNKDREVVRSHYMSRMEDEKWAMEEWNKLRLERLKQEQALGGVREEEVTKIDFEGRRSVLEKELSIAQKRLEIAERVTHSLTDQFSAERDIAKTKEKMSMLDYEEVTKAGELTGAWKTVADAVDSSFDKMVTGVQEGTLNIRKEFSNMINDMVRVWIRGQMKMYATQMVVGTKGILGSIWSAITGPAASPLESFYEGMEPVAHGAAFSHGGIRQFRRGAVFNTPHLFRFASGIGMLGEAGDEGVLPLARTRGGDLGVKTVQGSGQPSFKLEIVNNTGQPIKEPNVSMKFNFQETVCTVVLDAVRLNKYGMREAFGG